MTNRGVTGMTRSLNAGGFEPRTTAEGTEDTEIQHHLKKFRAGNKIFGSPCNLFAADCVLMSGSTNDQDLEDE